MYVRRREGMKIVDIMCSRLKRVQLWESKKYVFRGIKKARKEKYMPVMFLFIIYNEDNVKIKIQKEKNAAVN